MSRPEVTLKTVPAMHGLGVREKVAGPAGIGEVLADGFAGLQRAGAMVSGAPVSVYHDEEFCPDCIDVEVVFPVSAWMKGPLATPGGRTLAPRTLPGGEVAAVVHVGAFASISDSYETLTAWVAEYGYRAGGPARELYLSLREVGLPVTEIRLPVVPAAAQSPTRA